MHMCVPLGIHIKTLHTNLGIFHDLHMVWVGTGVVQGNQVAMVVVLNSVLMPTIAVILLEAQASFLVLGALLLIAHFPGPLQLHLRWLQGLCPFSCSSILGLFGNHSAFAAYQPAAN